MLALVFQIKATSATGDWSQRPAAKACQHLQRFGSLAQFYVPGHLTDTALSLSKPWNTFLTVSQNLNRLNKTQISLFLFICNFFFVLKNYTFTFLQPCCELKRLYWHTPRFASACLPAVSAQKCLRRRHRRKSSTRTPTGVPTVKMLQTSHKQQLQTAVTAAGTVSATLACSDNSWKNCFESEWCGFTQGFVEINHRCIILERLRFQQKRDLFRFHWTVALNILIENLRSP